MSHSSVISDMKSYFFVKLSSKHRRDFFQKAACSLFNTITHTPSIISDSEFFNVVPIIQAATPHQRVDALYRVYTGIMDPGGKPPKDTVENISCCLAIFMNLANDILLELLSQELFEETGEFLCPCCKQMEIFYRRRQVCGFDRIDGSKLYARKYTCKIFEKPKKHSNLQETTVYRMIYGTGDERKVHKRVLRTEHRVSMSARRELLLQTFRTDCLDMLMHESKEGSMSLGESAFPDRLKYSKNLSFFYDVIGLMDQFGFFVKDGSGWDKVVELSKISNYSSTSSLNKREIDDLPQDENFDTTEHLRFLEKTFKVYEEKFDRKRFLRRYFILNEMFQDAESMEALSFKSFQQDPEFRGVAPAKLVALSRKIGEVYDLPYTEKLKFIKEKYRGFSEEEILENNLVLKLYAHPKLVREEKEMLLLAKCARCKRRETFEVRWKRCSQCKIARYCNVQCQNLDWKRHKKECKKLKLEREKLIDEGRVLDVKYLVYELPPDKKKKDKH